MRELITIGELASLLKVNASTIRFYEKKGFIKPAKIDNNGYRLYGFFELGRMEVILLLRKLDIPLKEMNRIMAGYSMKDYENILKTSINSLDHQIEELKNKREYVSNKLYSMHEFTNQTHDYEVKYFPQRVLIIAESGQIFKSSIKDVYDLSMKNNIIYDNSFFDSYIIHLGGDDYMFCLEDSSENDYSHLEKLILPKGNYLIRGGFISNDSNNSSSLENFKNYIKDNNIKTTGKIISCEIMNISMFKSDSYYIQYQVMLDE